MIHGARRLVGKGVVGGDASVLAADRGGHLGVRLGTDHVTRGVDVRHVAAQELVHLHLGSPVQRDPGLLDFDEVRVRAPPGRDKQIRCFEFQAAAVGLDRCHDAGPAAAHCTHLGAGEDAHSLAFESCLRQPWRRIARPVAPWQTWFWPWPGTQEEQERGQRRAGAPRDAPDPTGDRSAPTSAGNRGAGSIRDPEDHASRGVGEVPVATSSAYLIFMTQGGSRNARPGRARS